MILGNLLSGTRRAVILALVVVTIAAPSAEAGCPPGARSYGDPCVVPGWDAQKTDDEILVPLYQVPKHCDARTAIFHIRSMDDDAAVPVTLYSADLGSRLNVEFTPPLRRKDVLSNLETDTLWQKGAAQQLCPQRQEAFTFIHEIVAALDHVSTEHLEAHISAGLVELRGPPGSLGLPSGKVLAVNGSAVEANIAATHLVGAVGRAAVIQASSRVGAANVFALGPDGTVVLNETLYIGAEPPIPLVSPSDFHARLASAASVVRVESFDPADTTAVSASYDLLRAALVDTSAVLSKRLVDLELIQEPRAYLAK